MSEPFYGYAFLAAQHKRFPMKALKVYEGINRPAIASACFLFGQKTGVLKEYLAMCADRKHMYERYLLNPWRDSIGAGMNSSELNQKIVSGNPKVINQIKRRIEKEVNFIINHGNPNTRPVMTYILEGQSHSYSKAAEKKVAKIVNKMWPWQTCTNSLYVIPNTDFREWHGENVVGPKTIISLDGVSINFTHRNARIKEKISEPDTKRFLSENSNAHAVLLWQDFWQDLKKPGAKPILQRNPRVPKKDRRKTSKWIRKVQ